MTVLEATVAADRIADLEREYRTAIVEIPAEIVQTFLARDARDATRFRIITVWQSMEALQAMRATGVPPKGIQMFQAAGASPELSIYDVVAERHR